MFTGDDRSFGREPTRPHDWGVRGSDPDSHDVEAMVDHRARLLAEGDRDDPELASLTRRLTALLGTDLTVRALDPLGRPSDRRLATELVSREPVNPAHSDREADRRQDRDRRIYVLGHPLLADRPINVLWVALCTGVPSTLDQVLSHHVATIDPTAADTAVFYSIWNAEDGLSGLGSGAELVARAARQLRAELPGLRTLTTMSPIPGFRRWCESVGEHRGGLRGGSGDLLTSCARYLTATGDDGRLLDPVARFHMGNGARLWRLLAHADDSERGIRRSHGMMANYRYFPEDIDANRRSLESGTPVLGDEVAALLARG